MNANKEPKIRPLADEEWDFGGVPENELEACFWWEYSRSSNEVARQLEGCQVGGDAYREACWSLARLALGGAFDLLSAWRFSPLGAQWRQMSWRLASAEAKKQWSATIADEMSRPLWILSGDRFLAHAKDMERYKVDGLWSVRVPKLGGSDAARGRARSSHVLTIDWNQPLPAIERSFSRWLHRNRRSTSERNARPTDASGQALGIRSFLESLHDLGCWKRRRHIEHVTSKWRWTAFLETYPVKVHSSRDKEVYSSTRRGFDRACVRADGLIRHLFVARIGLDR